MQLIVIASKQAYLFVKYDRLPKKAIGSTMLAAHRHLLVSDSLVKDLM